MDHMDSEWQCSRCNEFCPDMLKVCWNCGTSRTGQPDPTFAPVTETDEPLDDEPLWTMPRKSVRDLATIALLLVAGIMFIRLSPLLSLFFMLALLFIAPFSRQIVPPLKQLVRELLRRLGS